MSARTVAPARLVPDAALSSLGIAITPTGVVLGRDAYSAAVPVRLFGPAPMTVTFIGGWWAAQVIVHRMLAHGASVVVDALVTDTPARYGALAGMAQWLALGELAGSERVRPASFGPQWANATRPVVLLSDSGIGQLPPPAPWQTSLTVLTRVTPDDHDLIAASDVVLTQRLDAREAAMVGSALLLPPDFAANVGALDNGMIAACRSRAVRYIWLTPTTVESQAFG